MRTRATVNEIAGLLLGLALATPVCGVATAADKAASRPDRGSLTESTPVWRVRGTTMRRADIVAAGGGSVYSLAQVPRRPVSSADHLIVRQEVVGKAAARRVRARSSLIDLQIDCSASRVRVNHVSFFPRNKLQGAAESAALSSGWTELPKETYVAEVARRVCNAAPSIERRRLRPVRANS